jgi:UDP-N-acetylmuramyl pentapeptide synthase
MRRRLQDLPALLRTPIGRAQLISRLWYYPWPVLMFFAGAYRRTCLRRTRLIAVVGSFGKSTTTRAVLTALDRPIHPRFNYNSWSSLARAVFRIRSRDRHAVLEVGIGAPGQMAGYARTLRPDLTVVTSVGSEHNRSFETLENTRSEKSRMVQALPPSGVAVLNGDDPNVLWMKSRTSARVVTFGFQPENDVHAADLVLDWPHGMRFTLRAGGETRLVHIRLVGKHMVYPILAAVAVSLVEGVALDHMIPALEKMGPTRSRMEAIPLANGAWLIRDEYKSALETIDAALEVFAHIPARRRIAVLGEVAEPVGSQGVLYRTLGANVAKAVRRAIFIGMGKTWRSFASGARGAGLARGAIPHAGQSVLEALEGLRDIGPGDVVLVKGRDTQRLARISLALQGRAVRCDIPRCHAPVDCDDCPMLERGWNDARVVT